MATPPSCSRAARARASRKSAGSSDFRQGIPAQATPLSQAPLQVFTTGYSAKYMPCLKLASAVEERSNESGRFSVTSACRHGDIVERLHRCPCKQTGLHRASPGCATTTAHRVRRSSAHDRLRLDFRFMALAWWALRMGPGLLGSTSSWLPMGPLPLGTQG
jgi:hypothetical protein